MTDRALLQQALEALQAYGAHAPHCDHLMLLTSLPPQRKPCSCGLVAAITALRERLAQPEQEPVSEMLLIDEATVELALEALENVTKDYVENRQQTHNRAIEKLSKVFVQKPQRKPLTKKQCLHLEVHPLMTIEQVVRRVLAAQGIKGEA